MSIRSASTIARQSLAGPVLPVKYLTRAPVSFRHTSGTSSSLSVLLYSMSKPVTAITPNKKRAFPAISAENCSLAPKGSEFMCEWLTERSRAGRSDWLAALTFKESTHSTMSCTYSSCEICGSGFSYRCKLLDHMRTHTGDKVIICPN